VVSHQDVLMSPDAVIDEQLHSVLRMLADQAGTTQPQKRPCR
jgi:hypothetical protein